MERLLQTGMTNLSYSRSHQAVRVLSAHSCRNLHVVACRHPRDNAAIPTARLELDGIPPPQRSQRNPRRRDGTASYILRLVSANLVARRALARHFKPSRSSRTFATTATSADLTLLSFPSPLSKTGRASSPGGRPT